MCTILAGFLGTPGGLLLFIPNYHPLHDIFQIHSEVTFFILFTVFLLIIWSGDRTPKRDGFSSSFRTHWSTWILIVHLVAHYSSFLSMTIFFNAEDEVAIGLKEPIGNCDEYVPLQTIFGLVSYLQHLTGFNLIFPKAYSI